MAKNTYNRLIINNHAEIARVVAWKLPKPEELNGYGLVIS